MRHLMQYLYQWYRIWYIQTLYLDKVSCVLVLAQSLLVLSFTLLCFLRNVVNLVTQMPFSYVHRSISAALSKLCVANENFVFLLSVDSSNKGSICPQTFVQWIFSIEFAEGKIWCSSGTVWCAAQMKQCWTRHRKTYLSGVHGDRHVITLVCSQIFTKSGAVSFMLSPLLQVNRFRIHQRIPLNAHF